MGNEQQELTPEEKLQQKKDRSDRIRAAGKLKHQQSVARFKARRLDAEMYREIRENTRDGLDID